MLVQKPLGIEAASQLPNIFELAPILTSRYAGWNGISLEAHCLLPGETPEFCLKHYVVSISTGQKLEVEQIVEGKIHRAAISPGMICICPMDCSHSFRWDKEFQTLSLNLHSALLTQNAIELFETDYVELIPHLTIQDGLIQQIGLALQAELRSQGCGSRLYAESLANTLAIHLLRRYSTQAHRTISYIGGLPQHKLKLVIDYINDHLEGEVSLGELAAIAQLSQYHFCRAFKQTTGLSPHQYLLKQRVERAKQFLQSGKMRIGEVATACGFTHQSHMHRHFKRLTGVTPKAWINS